MPKVKRYTKEQEELILKNAYKKGVKLSYQEMADMFQKKYQECVAESERVKNA